MKNVKDYNHYIHENAMQSLEFIELLRGKKLEPVEKYNLYNAITAALMKCN